MNNLNINTEKKNGILKKLEPKFKSKIGFSTQEGIHFIDIRNIRYLHAVSNYTEVHLINGKMIVIAKTLKTIQELLPESGFKRCHQSYVINLEEVVFYKDSIILSNDKEIPISRRRKIEFKNWFNNKVAFV